MADPDFSGNAGRRRVLTGNLTVYVRTDGNDSNDGLTNTAEGAFLTMQAAVDMVCQTLDWGVHQVLILCGAGTYTATVSLKGYVGYTIPILRGDTTTPTNVVISVTGASCVVITADSCGQWWRVEGFQVTCTGATSDSVSIYGGSHLVLGNMNYGAAGRYHIAVDFCASVQIASNYAISGGGASHMLVNRCSSLEMSAKTVTLTGTPAFSIAFMQVLSNAMVSAFGMTYSGGATGTRYGVTHNGTVRTGSAGANYFPGNAANYLATNGIYD
jgi:hypothetical protein